RAPSLRVLHLGGDGDLCPPGGLVGGRGVGRAAVRAPGAGGELQSSVVAVAGVDVPVPAALALGDAVPHSAVGRRAVAGRGEHSARGEQDRAGEDRRGTRRTSLTGVIGTFGHVIPSPQTRGPPRRGASVRVWIAVVALRPVHRRWCCAPLYGAAGGRTR